MNFRLQNITFLPPPPPPPPPPPQKKKTAAISIMYIGTKQEINYRRSVLKWQDKALE